MPSQIWPKVHAGSCFSYKWCMLGPVFHTNDACWVLFYIQMTFRALRILSFTLYGLGILTDRMYVPNIDNFGNIQSFWGAGTPACFKFTQKDNISSNRRHCEIFSHTKYQRDLYTNMAVHYRQPQPCINLPFFDRLHRSLLINVNIWQCFYLPS